MGVFGQDAIAVESVELDFVGNSSSVSCYCFCSIIVLFHVVCMSEAIMKLILSFSVCLALSACATDYASQLSETHFGYRVLSSGDPVDPAQLRNGLYNQGPAGTAFCLSRYSREAPLWSSGFAP